MPRPRLPHLHKETARGKTFWYVRIGHGPRVRIRADYGTHAFNAAYQAVIATKYPKARQPRLRAANTLGWLWSLYIESPTWRRLSRATQKQRLNLMKPVLAKVGNEPLERFDRKAVLIAHDARAHTPAQARNFVGALRALFQWGVKFEHTTTDPTANVKTERIRGDGFHAWTAEELAAFEAKWPTGTRERLAYDILLWTGLRRGDACRIGPAHVKNGAIVIATAKTGTTTTIRILKPLAASLAATTIGTSTFIARLDGKPMVKEGFGNWFGDACRAAGVPGSAHGLRKALAIRVSERGATVAEMDALFAWSGGGMSSLYTRNASRERLADAALDRLEKTLGSDAE